VGIKAKEGRGSFLKKRTKKLFPLDAQTPRSSGWKIGALMQQKGKVFLLLFLQKKKSLPYPT